MGFDEKPLLPAACVSRNDQGRPSAGLCPPGSHAATECGRAATTANRHRIPSAALALSRF